MEFETFDSFVQACIQADPITRWLNAPEHLTTILILLGIEFLIHMCVVGRLSMFLITLMEWIGGHLLRWGRLGFHYLRSDSRKEGCE